ncbi:MAG: hypothetical protein ABR980_04285 [Ignavibacteriaceae bacterium]
MIKLRKSSSKKKTYLIIDDTIIAKPYSKELDLLSWIFSPSDRQYLYGINVVSVIWTDGNTRFPIGFRICVGHQIIPQLKCKKDQMISSNSEIGKE